MGTLELQGTRYVLATDEKGRLLFRQSYVPQQSSPYRVTGETLRENDPSIGHYITDDLSEGIGWAAMNRRTRRGVRGYRDATVDTRFRAKTIQRLHESQTHAAPLDHIRAYANFNGDFWALFEQDYTATNLKAVAVTKFTPDAWDAVDTPMFNAASTSAPSAGTTLTLGHTVQATHGNRIVIAFLVSSDAGTPDSAVTVTYAGGAMTQLGSTVSQGNIRLRMFYRLAPTTGANNIIATWADAMDAIGLHVMDYYFVNQSTPFGTSQSANAAAGGPTTSTSVPAVTTSSGDLVVGGVVHATAEATAVGTGQTELADTNGTGLGQETSEERATAATVTWNATWATDSAYCAIAAPLLSDGFISAPATTVAEGARGWDMTVHKSTLVVLATQGGAQELRFQVFSSADGDTFTPYVNLPAGATNLLTTTITRRNNWDDIEGRLLDFNNLLFAAVYDDATDNRIEVYSTNDVGASGWTAQGNVTDRYIHALLKWKDPTDLSTQIAILVTERNVYKINTTTNALDALLPEGILTGDPNDGRGAAVGLDGALYLPLGTGRGTKVTLSAENSFAFADFGPPGEGLVTARQGHINKLLVVPDRWLIAAYGGHAASRQASIFYIEYAVRVDPETGRQYQPWHSGYLEGDANIDLYLLGYSTEDDATPRLHYALESATSSEMFHTEEPFADPLSGLTIRYEEDSELRLPTDDLGDPHTTATFYTSRVDADALSAGSGGSGSPSADDEFIREQYGLDGDADTTVTLGDFLSGQRTLNYGTSGSITAFANAGGGQVTVTSAAHGLADGNIVVITGTTSYNGTFTITAVTTNTFDITDTFVADDATGTWRHGVGVAGEKIARRLTFYRGTTNTDTPQLYETEVLAENRLVLKRAWDFTIDVRATALEYSAAPSASQVAEEVVITNLEALAERTTLMTFRVGQDALTYVRAPNDSPPVWDLQLVGAEGDQRGYRTGRVTFHLEEVRNA